MHDYIIILSTMHIGKKSQEMKRKRKSQRDESIYPEVLSTAGTSFLENMLSMYKKNCKKESLPLMYGNQDY